MNIDETEYCKVIDGLFTMDAISTRKIASLQEHLKINRELNEELRKEICNLKQENDKYEELNAKGQDEINRLNGELAAVTSKLITERKYSKELAKKLNKK